MKIARAKRQKRLSSKNVPEVPEHPTMHEQLVINSPSAHGQPPTCTVKPACSLSNREAGQRNEGESEVAKKGVLSTLWDSCKQFSWGSSSQKMQENAKNETSSSSSDSESELEMDENSNRPDRNTNTIQHIINSSKFSGNKENITKKVVLLGKLYR